MTGREFGRAVVVSLIATFVATIYGYWEVAFNLPKLDIPLVLGLAIVPAGTGREFAYSFGMVQHLFDGILLGTIYFRLFRGWLPGWEALKGTLYGLMAWVGSSLVASPILGAGLFWIGWGGPATIGVLLWHIVWGLSLGLASYLSIPKGEEARWGDDSFH